MAELATVSSSDSAFGDCESAESRGSELGDAWHGLASRALQVVDCEFTT